MKKNMGRGGGEELGEALMDEPGTCEPQPEFPLHLDQGWNGGKYAWKEGENWI